MKKIRKTMSIGELIELEVRKQQLPIVRFAEMINCKRNNVYNLFKRNTIDILQLKQISKVLNRNFFRDLADDMGLITEVAETEETNKNREAVSQFLNVVPKIMQHMGKPSTIVFAKPDGEYYGPLPDFGMPELRLTFTVGETYRERAGQNHFVSVADMTDSSGIVAEAVTIIPTGRSFVNITVKYYSESEWEEIFHFVFDMLDSFNFIR